MVLRNYLALTSVFLLGFATPASATRYYVSLIGGGGGGLSWSTAYTDLRDALQVAQPGDEIWVAGGTASSPFHYYAGPPNAHPSSTLAIDGLFIYGGFDGTESDLSERAGRFAGTVLDGDLSRNDGPDFQFRTDNSFHTVTASGNNPTRLDGFTIRGGNAVPAGGDAKGGGMSISGTAMVEVSNCTFEENSAISGGGAESDGTAVFTDCSFVRNRATWTLYGGGGGLHCHRTRTVLERCRFEGNIAEAASTVGGGLLVNTNASVLAVECDFIQNSLTAPRENGVSYGGGAGVVGSQGSAFVNCRFVGNTSTGSGGAFLASSNSRAMLANCEFSGNVAGISGGGIYLATRGHVDIRNGTWGGNDAESGRGGGMLVGYLCSAECWNSILWGNVDSGPTVQDAQIYVVSGGGLDINYSSVEGWGSLPWGGILNDGNDPLFVDMDGYDDEIGSVDDDLQLLCGSPAIDAGLDNRVPVEGDLGVDLDDDANTDERLSLDVDGRQRFESTVDRGAHERQGALSVSREIVRSGDSVVFTVCDGVPGGIVTLAVTEVAGGPFFSFVSVGTFDIDGQWTLGAITPPGLEGFVVTLRSFAEFLGGPGASNEIVLRFE